MDLELGPSSPPPPTQPHPTAPVGVTGPYLQKVTAEQGVGYNSVKQEETIRASQDTQSTSGSRVRERISRPILKQADWFSFTTLDSKGFHNMTEMLMG